MFHIAWVTYNSRSKSKNNLGSGIILSDEEREQIARYLDEKIAKEKYRVLGLNVLRDHVHCLVVCEYNELPIITGQLKGYASHRLHAESTSRNRMVCPVTDKPQYSDGTRKKLWGSGYSNTFIKDESHYANTINYIMENHKKHGLKQLKHIFRNLTPLDKAFEP